MIATFMDQLASLLRETLAPRIPDQAITIGTTDQSQIALLPAQISFQQAREQAPGQGQALHAETIALDSANKGPYQLAKVPLTGSITAQLITQAGSAEEQTRSVLPDELSVDYERAQVNLQAAPPANATLALEYRYSASVVVCEFQQALDIVIQSDSVTETDQLGALVIATMLTNQEWLLERYNQLSPTRYHVQSVAATQSLRHIQLLEAQPAFEADRWRLTLRWRIFGLLHALRDRAAPAAIITTIISPAAPTDPWTLKVS